MKEKMLPHKKEKANENNQQIFTDDRNTEDEAGVGNVANTENQMPSFSGAAEETSLLAGELRYFAETLTDNSAEDANSEEAINEKSKLTLLVPQVGEVHKSTIVSLLNSNPTKISKDRLKRVRMCSKYEKETNSTIASNEIGLFDDVAIFTKDETPSYKIVRVIRMRNRARAITEYIRPISLNDMGKYPSLL